MSSVAIAAWVTIAIAILGIVARDGIRRGKLDQALETLTALVDDLEDRMRYQEGRPPRRRDSGGRHRLD